MQTTAAVADTMIVAEDAPLGVTLWPVTAPKYAPNFTLRSVAVVRDWAGERVVWTYENGSTRTFAKGEQVACRL